MESTLNRSNNDTLGQMEPSDRIGGLRSVAERLRCHGTKYRPVAHWGVQGRCKGEESGVEIIYDFYYDEEIVWAKKFSFYNH